jgi:hypothetical protein
MWASTNLSCLTAIPPSCDISHSKQTSIKRPSHGLINITFGVNENVANSRIFHGDIMAISDVDRMEQNNGINRMFLTYFSVPLIISTAEIIAQFLWKLVWTLCHWRSSKLRAFLIFCDDTISGPNMGIKRWKICSFCSGNLCTMGKKHGGHVQFFLIFLFDCYNQPTNQGATHVKSDTEMNYSWTSDIILLVKFCLHVDDYKHGDDAKLCGYIHIP